jgi:hypothetical protein
MPLHFQAVVSKSNAAQNKFALSLKWLEPNVGDVLFRPDSVVECKDKLVEASKQGQAREFLDDLSEYRYQAAVKGMKVRCV